MATLFVGVMAVAPDTTEAASCATFTVTLRQGARNSQVLCLQQMLNEKGFTVASSGAGSPGMETSYFGSLTRAAVVRFQVASGLVADGIFGPMSRTALLATSGGVVGLPAGCTSTSGFSPLTGVSCASGGVVTLPAGCTSTAGFSPLTGQSCAGGVVQPPIGGTLGVALAIDNPASGTLVAGQATADLAHFTFTGSGTVTGVKLKRIGVSADSTPSNVYLFNGATRLTDAASVASNGEVNFNVPAGIFTVNGSTTIAVKSDITSGTSGQTVGVMLVSYSTAAGTVATNGPSGNIHSIATATLATVASVAAASITPNGAILNPAANVTVWQSTLTISNRDVWMKRVAFRQVGSASASAFQNFKLYVNGVQVATAAGLDVNGYVTFDLNAAPVLLVAGSRIVRVDADIVSGASRTVHFSLRQASDVDFVDTSYGVNITPASTPWAPTSASTISGATGGSLTIEKDVSSPSTNLTVNGSDVNLGTFKMTAYGEAIKIETLTAGFTYADTVDDNPAGAGSTATLRNGRLFINGVQYGSTATLLAAGTSFTTNYTVYPGTPVLIEIHADVYDNDGTGDISATDTLLAKIVTGVTNATRVDSLGSFAAPATDVSANTLTVATTAITLSKNSTYANQNTTLPATNFKIGSYNLAGSSVEDVLLTTLSLDIGQTLVGAGFDYNDVTNLYAVVKNSSGVIVAQPTPIATPTEEDNNFTINYTLAKNTNVTIEFFANLASSVGTVDATDAFDTILKVSGISSVSGQAVSSGNGSTTIAGQSIAYAVATITVSKDASSPVTAIAYDNQILPTLAAKFVAVTAGYNITDLTVTVGASANTVVQNVMLYDGANWIATAPLSTATTAVFSGLTWNVPANTSKVLTVKLQLGTIGIAAGTTGATVTTSIANATDFTATNTSTGVSATGAGTATGSTMYAYAAIPTIAEVALPTTVLAAGTKVLAKFSVTSNGGDIAWKQVLFDISKSADPTIASVALWDVTGGGNTQITAEEVFQFETVADAACDASDTVCELLISVGTNDDDNVEEQVSGTKTYEVRATIGGALSAAESISTSIQSNRAHITSNVFTTDGVSNDISVDDATFTWSDVSAQSHDTGTTDWTNENLVKVLPTSTWTMTFPSS